MNKHPERICSKQYQVSADIRPGGGHFDTNINAHDIYFKLFYEKKEKKNALPG